MDQKDRNNLKGMIKQCLINSKLITIGRIAFPLFKYELTDQILDFLQKKQKAILDVYEQNDIYYIIVFKSGQLFGYHHYSKKLKEILEDDETLDRGKLSDFLNEKEMIEVADFILIEFENPEYSYALVQLPNIELKENIRINENLILVGDLEVEHEGEGYFRIDDTSEKDFRFLLYSEGSYLLIRHLGSCYQLPPFLKSQEPLVFKNIKQELKVFLGLSLIRGIFGITNEIAAQAHVRSNLSIGIFSSTEWAEGGYIPSDIQEDGELLPEAHEDFENVRSDYSEGDDLRYLCFQKRFFLSNEIELPQGLRKLINSFYIGEKIVKGLLSLAEGKIVPLPHIQQATSVGEYLREEFRKMKILFDANDDYAERIKAASLWYLEGHCSDNDTVKFINYTIAIESLLGEKTQNNVPLTQGLSNKCGFWLGKNLKEKEEIRRLFKNRIYKTRSRIIHRGETILKKKDNEILKELETIAKRLIKEAMETYNAS